MPFPNLPLDKRAHVTLDHGDKSTTWVLCPATEKGPDSRDPFGATRTRRRRRVCRQRRRRCGACAKTVPTCTRRPGGLRPRSHWSPPPALGASPAAAGAHPVPRASYLLHPPAGDRHTHGPAKTLQALAQPAQRGAFRPRTPLPGHQNGHLMPLLPLATPLHAAVRRARALPFG